MPPGSAPPPERIFAALARQRRRGLVFLDGALEMNGLGRFSYIAFEPFEVLRKGGCDAGPESAAGFDSAGALRSLFEKLNRHPVARHPALPFTGGAVGYIGYECGARLERVRPAAPGTAALPELAFAFYDGVIVHDHATGETHLAALPLPRAGGATADEILGRLRDAVAAAAPTAPSDETPLPHPAPASAPVSNFSRDAYLSAIARIKDYIAAGDVYQVNLAQRFTAPLAPGDTPAALHLRLRARSPAPFAAYLDFGDHQIVSSSPERFLQKSGPRLETRPIKGTRPRGDTPAGDARLAAELVASAKDCAELLMIVDLMRNDLGRVCAPGTVRVDDPRRLETHPTVHHLVATISGRLAPGRGLPDALLAALPGGSITGAPKIRAMQIIAELEPHRRHVYTGALGWLGFNGDADLAVAIRTLACADGEACYHVGGGITWDSDPAAEYEETLAKGRAMQAALTAR
ncbi:hypothetical protein AW736_19545 [Termitidicoccus mucosus]|uniref:aminodeoxychorismate synthase n=1 Tax=Termitidicoccus mucosus TaxID=1184151 RepID=A0A178IGY1_9BACT|nr:hypothetical protein AW736_19545 [Opitutaceae bacterium TSB47]